MAAMSTLLDSRGLTVDGRRTIITRGKSTFDARIATYNQAAQHAPWLAVRDLDDDANGCPVDLRRSLVPVARQSPRFALRIAERSLEAWLMADRDKFASFFGVSPSLVPLTPEHEASPKRTVVNLCRKSRSSSVRRGMVPPTGTPRLVGPEYTSFISEFAADHWRPEIARESAPSLERTLLEIDRLVAEGHWD